MGYSGVYCSAFAGTGVLCEGSNTISQNCTGLAANYRDNSSSIGYDYLCCPDGVDCVKSNAYCGSGVGAAICIREGNGAITCSGVSPSPYSYNVSRCIAMPITTTTTSNMLNSNTPTTTPTAETVSSAPNKMGIEIGVPIAAVALLCIVAYFVLRYNKRKRMNRGTSLTTDNSESNTIIMKNTHKPEEIFRETFSKPDEFRGTE
jgi:hypothetical protein